MSFYILAIILIIFFLASAIKILKEYERGVIFRLGRVIKTKGPGLIILIPISLYIGAHFFAKLRKKIGTVPFVGVLAFLVMIMMLLTYRCSP